MQNKYLKPSIFFLILLYAVGAYAMLFTSYSQLFSALTPLSLLITFAAIILFQKNKNAQFYLFLILGFLIGFFAEVIGVQTGLIFGDYQYGEDLGLKLFKTPLTIGLNWVLLSLAIGSFIEKTISNLALKIIAASLLMVLLDFIIEPAAIHFNWWTWKNQIPEIQNYVGWFAISVLIFSVYFNLKFDKNNSIANAVLLIMILFFLFIRFFV